MTCTGADWRMPPSSQRMNITGCQSVEASNCWARRAKESKTDLGIVQDECISVALQQLAVVIVQEVCHRAVNVQFVPTTAQHAVLNAKALTF